MDQRGWILSAYHKVQEAKLKLVEKKSKLEKELCDLQGWLSMLQCQNYTLADQVSIFQLVAEKAAVKVHKLNIERSKAQLTKRSSFSGNDGGKKRDQETF